VTAISFQVEGGPAADRRFDPDSRDPLDDVLFVALAHPLGSALLVVTLRDIIRCGWPWSFRSRPWPGSTSCWATPSSRRRKFLVYIGAISVLILFAHADPDQERPHAAGLPDTAWIAAVARWRSRSDHGTVLHNLASGGKRLWTATADIAHCSSTTTFCRSRCQRAPDSGRRGGVTWPDASPIRARRTGREQLVDTYLFSRACSSPSDRSASWPANAISMLMSIELMTNAVNLTSSLGLRARTQQERRGDRLLIIAVAAAEATLAWRS